MSAVWNNNIFEILEIEPTYEEKKIKKAYAKLVKKYHPEEYPEKWKEIHAAYETALGLAKKEQGQGGGVNKPEAVIVTRTSKEKPPETKEKPPETVMKTEKTENASKPPKAVMKTEKTEIESKLPEESDEIETLFDNIEELSRQQQRQNEEERKRTREEALETAVAELKRMAAKKRLNKKEWEAFFQRENIRPVICSGAFLYELGECFNNKKINKEMYQFLLEQLAWIEQYRKDELITGDGAGVSDPLGYARGKIHSACKVQGYLRDFFNGTAEFVKALAWLLVAALTVTGFCLRISRLGGPTPEERQRQYEQNAEKFERDREIIEEWQRIIEEEEKLEKELSQNIELIEVGDTREKMISVYGEPDRWQKDSDRPNYEDAHYHLYGVDITITLYIDVVMNVHYKAGQDENKSE